MTGGLLRKAKKIINRGGSNLGESSQVPTSPETPVHPDSFMEDTEDIPIQPPHHSSYEQRAPPADGICLIDSTGITSRRRGRTTCADIQSLPPGTRVHIEVNEYSVPCNFPEATLLNSYLVVIVRDSVLAPISFPDWRIKGMKPFKKRMLAEIECKFAMPGSIKPWLLKSLGVKWRNHKTSLKAAHWDSRPFEEIMETVPEGIDPAQWYQLVGQWSTPEDKSRAAKNVKNAKKQIAPHTMGRISTIRRQKETAIHDRLQLWRINRLHKDGSWSSEDVRLRRIQACDLLAEEGLRPEDGNLEANERVFTLVMGPEHPGGVRTQGLGVTLNRYFPNSTTTEGSSSGSFDRVGILEEDFRSFRSTMMDFMQEMRSMNNPSSRSSQMILQMWRYPKQIRRRWIAGQFLLVISASRRSWALHAFETHGSADELLAFSRRTPRPPASTPSPETTACTPPLAFPLPLFVAASSSSS